MTSKAATVSVIAGGGGGGGVGALLPKHCR